MRTVKFATLVIAASATLFACKPKEEAPTPATGEVTEEDGARGCCSSRRGISSRGLQPHDDGAGKCRLDHLLGVLGRRWQRREIRSLVQRHGKSRAGEQLPRDSARDHLQQQRIAGISITLSAQNATESDVPMGPGSYPIWGREQSAVKGAQFAMASLTFNGRAFDSRSGTITISEFTTEGVEGSFTLDGAEMKLRKTPHRSTCRARSSFPAAAA